MTEEDWLACADTEKMLMSRGAILFDPLAVPELVLEISDRQLTLFACACWRRVWHVLSNELCQVAVSTAEAFADRRCDAMEIQRVRQQIEAAHPDALEISAQSNAFMGAYFTCCDANAADVYLTTHPWQGDYDYRDNPLAALVGASADCAAWCAYGPGWHAERRTQCNLLRDIVGNPFRPVAISATWLSPTVLSLAQTIYDERAFDRMPILADALEEAGCDNADILTHCRQPAEHVRGCWVVDLVLGKK